MLGQEQDDEELRRWAAVAGIADPWAEQQTEPEGDAMSVVDDALASYDRMDAPPMPDAPTPADEPLMEPERVLDMADPNRGITDAVAARQPASLPYPEMPEHATPEEEAADLAGESPEEREAVPDADEQTGTYMLGREMTQQPQQAVPMPSARPSGQTDKQLFWALALDALVNKGRGQQDIMKMFGGMRGAGGNPLDDELKRARIEQIRGGNPYAQERLGISREQLALDRAREERLAKEGEARIEYRGTREGRMEEEQAARLDPNHPQARGLAEFMVSRGIDPSYVEGKNFEQLRAMARETGLMLDYVNRGERAAVASAKAGASAAATLPYDLQVAQAGAQARIAGEQEAYSGEIPGIVTTDPQARKMAMGDPQRRSQVYSVSTQYPAIVEGLDKMIALRQKHGVELPGEAQAEFDSAKTTVVGALTQLGNTGVLNEGEWKRYSEQLPGLQPSWNDLLSLATGQDINLSQLQGVRRNLRGTIRTKMRPYGVDIDESVLSGNQNLPPANALGTQEQLPPNPLGGPVPESRVNRTPRSKRPGARAPKKKRDEEEDDNDGWEPI